MTAAAVPSPTPPPAGPALVGRCARCRHYKSLANRDYALCSQCAYHPQPLPVEIPADQSLPPPPELLARIVHYPGLAGPEPRLRGRKIPVAQILHELSQGQELHHLQLKHPGFEVKDLQAVLTYARGRITGQIPPPSEPRRS